MLQITQLSEEVKQSINLQSSGVETAIKAQQMHKLAVEAAGEKAILVYYSKELESVTESQLIRLMQDMSIGKTACS